MIQGAHLDLVKRMEAGTLSEQDKRDMRGMRPYQTLMHFTAVWSKEGLPNPKSVEDILEQVQDVMPALHEKAKVYQKEGTITGCAAGLEDRFASKVRQIEKKVTELKKMNDKSRARLSAADLLSIRQDLQKRVGIILNEIMTDLNDASRTVKQILLDSENAFKGALAEARARTFGWRRKAYLVSTPTIAGRSRIEREYQASDPRRSGPASDTWCGSSSGRRPRRADWRRIRLAPGRRSVRRAADRARLAAVPRSAPGPAVAADERSLAARSARHVGDAPWRAKPRALHKPRRR